MFWNSKQRAIAYSIRIRIKLFRLKSQEEWLVTVNNAYLKISIAAIPENLQSAALITEEMYGEGGSEIDSINSVNEAMISEITSLFS